MPLSLSDEQKKIVEAPPDIKLLVTAGSGTGKTYALIARLIELIDRFGLSPGREVLVLSFSRGAVKEIRGRIQKLSGNIRLVRARTFDSFGTFLLSEIDPGGDWESKHLNYDERIERAVMLLEGDDRAREFISRYSHILVDEIQDLVGIRAEMVKSLLKITSGGFTLLGDPAQGIYNFQLEGDDRIEGSAKLYRWLRAYFKDELKEYTLSENLRAVTDSAKKALWAGGLLNEPNPDYDNIKYGLDNVVIGLPILGKPKDITTLLKPIDGKSAFLCRTNGQALIISRELWESGVRHSYQRSATDRVLPEWIAILFSGSNLTKIGRSGFEDRYTRTFGDDPALAWRELKRIEAGSFRDSLDLTKLAEHILIGMVPDDLFKSASDNIIVSTIHRAKGMEFERVIVMDKSPNIRNEDYEIPEETRILYVGLTRPKMELYCLADTKVDGYIRLEDRSERWVRQYNPRIYKDIEIRGNDVHSLDPAGGFCIKGCDSREIRDYILENVNVGDEALLVRVDNSIGNHPPYLYEIRHKDNPVGVLTESFSWDLFQTLKINRGWKVNWPVQIEGTRVETLDTVAGTRGSGKQAGLGDPDIWVRVRVVGLGTMKFDKMS